MAQSGANRTGKREGGGHQPVLPGVTAAPSAPHAPRTLARLRRRAWRALAWERAAPLLWPFSALVCLFLSLAGLDLLPQLPGWGHGLVLVGFVGLAAWLVIRLVRRWHSPLVEELDRRIEQDSHARHRPLAVLQDEIGSTLAGSDARGAAMATALWAAHQQRMANVAARLRVRGGAAAVAASDPYALRYLSVMLLVVVALGSRGDWEQRLLAAVSPSLTWESGPVATASIDAWLSPPPATGLPPIFLAAGAVQTPPPPTPGQGPAVAPAAKVIDVPLGSKLTIRVGGASGVPVLIANGAEREFQVVDGHSFQSEAVIRSGDRIAVTQRGRALQSWPVRVVPDNPPAVVFVNPPAAADRKGVRLEYLADDDYGVARLRLKMTLAQEPLPGIAHDPFTLDLPLGAVHPRTVRGNGMHDLTDHPWAGLPVTLLLEAEDTAGQTAQSAAAGLVLPERAFANPLAQAIIAQRRRLTLEQDTARGEVSQRLRQLAEAKAAYQGDIVVFMALTTAAERLVRDTFADAISSVERLLWEVALRIEDGGLTQAERELRQAQQALSQALERGADEAELRALMDRLDNAMETWMATLEAQMRKALSEGVKPTPLPPELIQRMTDKDELQGMMDRLREMTETGARDAARQMLSQLQEMLSQMQTGPANAAQAQSQAKAFELLRRIKDLTQKEQGLADESFRLQQQGVGNDTDELGLPRRKQQTQRSRQTASPLLQKQADAQAALRKGLGDLLREMDETLGDIPRPFAKAEREMRDAETALRSGSPTAALAQQSRAIDDLQKGLQGFAEQLMQQMTGSMPGAASAQPGGQGGKGRDPLGRGNPAGMGGMDTGNVKMPTKVDAQRAREILDELRRRAGELSRPQLERDYIDRLLRRF